MEFPILPRGSFLRDISQESPWVPKKRRQVTTKEDPRQKEAYRKAKDAVLMTFLMPASESKGKETKRNLKVENEHK